MKLISALIAALTIAAPVSANTLYPDSLNYDSLGGRGTYNSGDYTKLRDNDLNRNSLYDSTIRDNNSVNYYDCDTFGTCRARRVTKSTKQDSRRRNASFLMPDYLMQLEAP